MAKIKYADPAVQVDSGVDPFGGDTAGDFKKSLKNAQASMVVGQANENAAALDRTKVTADATLAVAKSHGDAYRDVTKMNVDAEAPGKKATTTGVELSNDLKRKVAPDLVKQIKAGATLDSTQAGITTASAVRTAQGLGFDVGGDQQVGNSPGDFIADAERRRQRDNRLAIAPTYSLTSDPKGKMKVHSAPGKLK